MLFTYKVERVYTLLGVYPKLQDRMKNTANRNLNNIMGLTVSKTEIFENVVTVDEYFFSLYISLIRSLRSPMQNSRQKSYIS